MNIIMVKSSFTTLDLKYAQRFYGFKGEAQYLHGHTGLNEAFNLVNFLNVFESLEAIQDDHEEELSDNGANVLSICENIYNQELQETIYKVLLTLRPREFEVITQRFGLFGKDEKTLEELGRYYNLTRERIRQIEAKAVNKLRHPTRSKTLREFL